MDSKLKNISLFSIFRDVVFNAWIIFLVGIMAYMGSYIYVYNFNTLKYTSSMTLAVSDKSSSSFMTNRLTKTKETANIFQTIFQSDILRTKIEDVTGKPLAGTITATMVSETNLIILTAEAENPIDAYESVTAVFENYRYLTDYAFEDTVMYVLSSATVPSYANNTISLRSTFFKAAPISCGLVLLIIILLSFMRDTVKSEDGIKENLLLDVFGVVYHERKNKTFKTFIKNKNKRVFINDPLTNKTYIESFKRIAVKLEYLHSQKDKKVFMIASTNENEGKTTIAVNTAITLAESGNRVLLVDLDLRKPSIWRFFPSIDYSDENRQQIADIIKGHSVKSIDVAYDKDSGLFLLAGKKSVVHSSEYLSKDRFDNLIKKLSQQFDFIIIDTPPYALISDSEIIAKSVDGILLVVRQDNSTIDAINDTISALSRSGPILGCIYNDVKTLPGIITGVNAPISAGSYSKYYR